MIDGIINVYKEKDYTSFDVCAKLRGILKQKKIGHTGTLDPMAEGVLMVCLGKATKLVDMLTVGDKEYKAKMVLGLSTDTEDITGKVLEKRDVDLNLDENTVLEVINSFVGNYDQIPPMYSAIKKDGKKLYEYARAGVSIEREPRSVEIYSIDNIAIDLPYISFDVKCSKGTYIRSLVRDIGEKIGTLGTLTELTRNNVHGYLLENSYKLSDIERLRDEGKLEEVILPIDVLLSDYPILNIKESQKSYLFNGNKLGKNQFEENNIDFVDENLYRIYYDKECLGLYRYIALEDILKPYKMFLG